LTNVSSKEISVEILFFGGEISQKIILNNFKNFREMADECAVNIPPFLGKIIFKKEK
jgi:hypothetical protein